MTFHTAKRWVVLLTYSQLGILEQIYFRSLNLFGHVYQLQSPQSTATTIVICHNFIGIPMGYDSLRRFTVENGIFSEAENARNMSRLGETFPRKPLIVVYKGELEWCTSGVHLLY